MTARLAYFLLIPVGLVLSLTILQLRSSFGSKSKLLVLASLIILVLPFVAASYAFLIQRLTGESNIRFRPSRYYFLHDVAIAGFSILAAVILAIIG